METEPCGPDDTFWKQHATDTVRRPGLFWEGTPGAGCSGGTPLCAIWTPACGHACSLALALVFLGSGLLGIPCCCQGKDEGGGRDASPHRPCWSAEGLKGRNGWG